MQLVSFYTLWKQHKIKGILMFSDGIEREQRHEIWVNLHCAKKSLQCKLLLVHSFQLDGRTLGKAIIYSVHLVNQCESVSRKIMCLSMEKIRFCQMDLKASCAYTNQQQWTLPILYLPVFQLNTDT